MICVLVQHHPSRASLLPALKKSLTPLSVEVVVDDKHPLSPWRGYQACLRQFLQGGADFGVVLQDDVRVCINFPLAVEQVALANPETPICLYLGGLPKKTASDALKAIQRGEHYVPIYFRDFVPVVGVLWPRMKAQEFLEWSKAARLPGRPPSSDDAIVGFWMRMTKQRIFATVPSLVQHPDETSIVNPRRAKAGRDRGRTALMFCENDPLDLDWARI